MDQNPGKSETRYLANANMPWFITMAIGINIEEARYNFIRK